VNDRSEPGHPEADHIIGRANQSALMCLTERVSR
jgi:IS30 family transposase